MPLTMTAIKSAKGRDQPYKLTDSDGLHLLVQPSGGRYWRMHYRFLGKQKSLAFGVWADISLADARAKRDAARRLIANGVDPGEKAKQDKIAANVAAELQGFRAMAATLLNEMGLWNADAIERQLAHADNNAVRRAYARGEYWDERVRMMQHWSDHLDQLRKGQTFCLSARSFADQARGFSPTPNVQRPALFGPLCKTFSAQFQGVVQRTLLWLTQVTRNALTGTLAEIWV